MFFMFFFCKHKTAYEMRISDWSSDVCSSDLVRHRDLHPCARAYPGFAGRSGGTQACGAAQGDHRRAARTRISLHLQSAPPFLPLPAQFPALCDPGSGKSRDDRKSVVSGKSVSVRVDLGGRRIIKKKKKHNKTMITYAGKTH